MIIPLYPTFMSLVLVASLMNLAVTAEAGRSIDPVTVDDARAGLMRIGTIVDSKLSGLPEINLPPNTSILSGLIYDGFGALVPGAKITVREKASGKTFMTVSNAEGQYRLIVESENNSNGGIFRLEVVRDPFKAFIIEEYQIIFKGEMKLDISLVCDDCEETY